METQNIRRVISILIDNEFGALGRVVDLFAARGYNIDSLTVSVVDSKNNLSRINIVSGGDEKQMNLIVKLLNRLVPVHKAYDVTTSSYIEKELALVKVLFKEEDKNKITDLATKYGATVLSNKIEEGYIFQLIETGLVIDEFVVALSKFGLTELSKTGTACISKGMNILS